MQIGSIIMLCSFVSCFILLFISFTPLLSFESSYLLFIVGMILLCLVFVSCIVWVIISPEHFIPSCPFCGATCQNEPFCSSCGAELIPYCDCGHKVHDGETYCPDCGVKLE